MQYVEGETLAASLTRHRLKLREALAIATQVADALAEAHAHKIIHRDIKPQNIMITARGQVKVLDFGLAKVLREPAVVDSEAETVSLLTASGTIVGTVPYMSPEQVRGEEIGAPSDIFSFGCVLYEMVTGHRAFARPTAAETMAAVLKDDPPALSESGNQVPRELDQVVKHCLEKNPADRFQSARDLAFTLRAMPTGGTGALPPRRVRRRDFIRRYGSEQCCS